MHTPIKINIKAFARFKISDHDLLIDGHWWPCLHSSWTPAHLQVSPNEAMVLGKGDALTHTCSQKSFFSAPYYKSSPSNCRNDLTELCTKFATLICFCSWALLNQCHTIMESHIHSANSGTVHPHLSASIIRILTYPNSRFIAILVCNK